MNAAKRKTAAQEAKARKARAAADEAKARKAADAKGGHYLQHCEYNRKTGTLDVWLEVQRKGAIELVLVPIQFDPTQEGDDYIVEEFDQATAKMQEVYDEAQAETAEDEAADDKTGGPDSN